ncbi:MAG: hypothetical protein JXR60_03655 [Bacteroidales bacterium]|nr:hypothetical protein [Bacteroidales bacterium]
MKLTTIIQNINTWIIILGLIFIHQAKAQDISYPYSILQFPFIDYQHNVIDFPSDSNQFDIISQKLNRMILEGEGKLTILQIGGSHIQADIYSNVARYRLQHFYPGLDAGRGFVFPYAIAKTNNPVNIKVEYTGQWDGCRNVQKNKTCFLGLAGISVSTSDSSASFKIYSYESYHSYDFNHITLFYNLDSSSYRPVLAYSELIDSIYSDTLRGFQTIYYKQYIDTFALSLEKVDTFQRPFVFYGADLQTNDPGVVYHSIGINGASIPSFLRCQLFEQQLSVLSPDLVILSIGTNDAYGKTFDPEVYFNNYDTLIQRILKAVPNTALMITVPNDDYLYKRRPNPHTALQEKEIYLLAKKYHAGVWNLYKIMGGFNSSQVWYNYGLMKYDRIHFTKDGYLLKGDLFFNAFLKMYDSFIESKLSKNSLLDIGTNN